MGTAVTVAPGLGQGRARHGAMLLASGKVLLVGGYVPDPGFTIKGLTSAELFDPATGSFQPTGSMASPRYSFGCVPLSGGRVMVVTGGWALASAEVYDPTTGVFTDSGFPGQMWQSQATTDVLADGRVVAMGMPYNTLVTYVTIFFP